MIAPKERTEVRTRTIASHPGLARLEADWKALQSRLDDVTVFSSWQWNAAAARHFVTDGDLRVMVVEEDGAVIAIAPFARRRVAGLRALTLLGACQRDYSRADYQDILIEPGHEAVAMREIADALEGARDWEMLLLPELPAKSRALAHLERLASVQGWTFESATGSDVYRVELPETWEAYLARLSGNMRNGIGRKTRKLAGDGTLSFAPVSTEDDLTAAMQALFDLHEARWRPEGGRRLFAKPTIFPDAQTRAFHLDLARSLMADGMLDLRLLQHDDETVGARYSFVFKGTKSFYASGYRVDEEWLRLSPGLVMDALSLRDSIEQGLRREDFLRNDGDYKQHYDPERSDNVDVVVYRNAAAAGRYRAYQKLRSLARAVARRLRG